MQIFSDNISHENLYDSIIVGGGISGLSTARRLSSNGYNVLVLEKEDSIGGLIRCSTINGNLYHLVGGHVFNTQIDVVSKFFWDNICCLDDFAFALRKAVILLDEGLINYPIENNLASLPGALPDLIVEELLDLFATRHKRSETLGEFLGSHFGQTLCDLYFFPYNKKVWQMNPFDMAIEWLDGKLPMPSIPDILKANIAKASSANMVHDSFYYPVKNGSQHIVNAMAKGLNVRTQ
jgi:protoporphyrinogen oxidase